MTQKHLDGLRAFLEAGEQGAIEYETEFSAAKAHLEVVERWVARKKTAYDMLDCELQVTNKQVKLEQAEAARLRSALATANQMVEESTALGIELNRELCEGLAENRALRSALEEARGFVSVEGVEKYLETIPMANSTNMEKTLTHGNIRGFAGRVRDALSRKGVSHEH